MGHFTGRFTLQQTHMHYGISVLLASFHVGAPRRFGTQVASLTKTIKSILDRYPEGGQILKVLSSLHCTPICLIMLSYLDAWYFKARTELAQPFFNRGGRQEALNLIKRNGMFTWMWQQGLGEKHLQKWSIDCTSQPDSIPCKATSSPTILQLYCLIRVLTTTQNISSSNYQYWNLIWWPRHHEYCAICRCNMSEQDIVWLPCGYGDIWHF